MSVILQLVWATIDRSLYYSRHGDMSYKLNRPIFKNTLDFNIHEANTDTACLWSISSDMVQATGQEQRTTCMLSQPATSGQTLPGSVKLGFLLDWDSAVWNGATPDMVAACSKALLAA